MVLVSRRRERVMLGWSRQVAPRATLSQPFEIVNGLPLNPRNSAPRYTPLVDGISIIEVTTRTAGEVDWPTRLPLLPVGFSPDERDFAFGAIREDRIELWHVESRSARPTLVTDRRLSATSPGQSVASWIDAKSLLCRCRPTSDPPSATDTDDARALRFFQNQLAIVDTNTGDVTDVGAPDVFGPLAPSPDGKYILVARWLPPFPRALLVSQFGRAFEVWSRERGEVARRLVTEPPGQRPTPLRAWRWHPFRPATLVWIGTRRSGDEVLALQAPFEGEPLCVVQVAGRIRRICWTEAGGLLVWTRERDSPIIRLFHVGTDGCTVLMAEEDVRGDRGFLPPGVSQPDIDRIAPVFNTFGTGQDEGLAAQAGQGLLVKGRRTSPRGTHHYLDRVDVRTSSRERIWEASADVCEAVQAALDSSGSLFLTIAQSIGRPPTPCVIDLKGSRTIFDRRRRPTSFLVRARRHALTYSRGDGIQLASTVSIPERPAPPLPFLIWIYPELLDVAHNRTDQPHFNRYCPFEASGPSPLVVLERGLGVAHYPAMPVFDAARLSPESHLVQLEADIRPLVSALVDQGIADARRLVIGGYCFGGTAAVMLLTRTNFFCAGIACNARFHAPDWALCDPTRLTAPLLLLHGDDGAPAAPGSHSRDLARAIAGAGGVVECIDLGLEGDGFHTVEAHHAATRQMVRWCQAHTRLRPPARRIRLTENSEHGRRADN